MIEESTIAVAEAPTEAPSAPSEVNRLGSILDESLGIDSGVSEDESSAQPANALEPGNPTEKTPDAPVSGEPASPEDDAANGETAEQTAEEKEAEDNSLLNAILETEPEEKVDDPSVWKGRYSDATRHIGELNERLKAINEVLASQGRQVIETKEGLKLATTEDAEGLSPDVVNAEGIYQSLTSEERDLFIDDPEQAAKMLVDKTVKEIAEKFTPAEASASDKILTQSEADQVYDDFLSCKLPDGKTARFPDADNDSVRGLMETAYKANTDVMQRFRDIASKDPLMQYAMLEYLYNKVYRGRQMQLAIQAQKQKAINSAKETSERESKLSSQGASGSVKGQVSGNANPSQADLLLSKLDEALG